MRVLVTGGHGFVGSHLVRRCLAEGDVVRCLVRREGVPQSLDGLPVDLVVGDVTRPESLAAAVSGIDVVYHLAGRLSSRSRAEMFATNVGGTRNLVDATTREGGAGRFVYCSSIAVAGPSSPTRPHTESEDGVPVTWYGASKALAERVVVARAKDRVPVTIVRPPIVYGPRDRGLLPVFATVGNGVRPVIGRGRRYSWVYGPDLADAFFVLGRHPRTAGATFYATHPEVSSIEAVLDLVAAAAGRRGITVDVPDSAVRLIARLGDLLTQATGSPGSLTSDKVHEVVAPEWVCSGDAALAVAGWRAKTALATGIPETVRWYQANGWMRTRRR